jgi:hypothetical protein
MLATKLLILATGATAMALTSCAPPTTAEVSPVPKPTAEVPIIPELSAPVEAPRKPSKEIQLPPMFDNLPKEGEFRASNPAISRPGETGAVISRPPTDPPARVKPQEAPAE